MRKRRPRIAVIDDERPYAWASAFALGDEFDVLPLTSPRELVDAIERGDRFDLILSDMQMPEMGGLQLLRVVRLVAPEQADRIFFLTGFLEESQLPLELRPRVASKPTNTSDLVGFVKERLARFDT